MTVMMPVRALNDHCTRCPELDIQVDQLTFRSGDQDYAYDTQLYCTHFKRCAMILTNLEKDMENVAKKGV